jgi:hypothetical protein
MPVRHARSGTPGQVVAHQAAAAPGQTGGGFVKHSGYYWLLVAEGHLTPRLFEAMLQRICALPVPGRLIRGGRPGNPGEDS